MSPLGDHQHKSCIPVLKHLRSSMEPSAHPLEMSQSHLMRMHATAR